MKKICKRCNKKKEMGKSFFCKTCKKEKGRSPNWYRKQCVAFAKAEAKKRDKYICQRCGRDGRQYQIHGSHVFSEGGHPSLSADIENIKSLCAQCHFWWHENPAESFMWFQKKFPERYIYLCKQSKQNNHLNWQKKFQELKGLDKN